MIEHEEAIANDALDAVERGGVCGVCGTAEDLVDGHLIETPTGEICVDCAVEVIAAT